MDMLTNAKKYTERTLEKKKELSKTEKSINSKPKSKRRNPTTNHVFRFCISVWSFSVFEV